MDRFIVSAGSGISVGTGVNTYSGLLTTMGEWLDREDLSGQFPNFIRLLEAKLNRVLRTPDMEETVELTANPTADLPTDFLEVRSLRISDGREIEQTSLQALHELYEDNTGAPMVFAIANGAIHLGPAPADEETLTLVYYKQLDAISSDNESNWITTYHPDIYLFGALTYAEAFLWDDERVPLWKAAFEEAMAELQMHGIKKRHGGTLIPRARNVV